MSARRVLSQFRAPEEREAEERAWEAVRHAFQHQTAPSLRPVRRRLSALAGGLVLVSAVALSPAGATVGHLIARGFSSPIRTTALPAPQALVTDEAQNRLLIVNLPSGQVSRRVTLPSDPEDIAASPTGGVVAVVSSRTGKVTILDRRTLRVLKTFGGFGTPHIVGLSPDGRYAYVTDDVRGTLTVIRLSDLRVTAVVRVGAQAHHLTFSPDERHLWIGLGESAARIAVLDTTNLARPQLIASFNPGFPAHDLSFTPDGRQVWITSASGPDVTAFDAFSRRALFRVPVGPPPQHVLFAGGSVYLTSGYGSTIERVDLRTHRVLTRTGSPYGSFELAAADGYLVTSSLLRGTLAVYTPGLRLLRVVTLAPATREVAISRP